ncbi:MAG: hypothetical protein AB7Q17_11475 [Phycisphaerae bacterium]
MRFDNDTHLETPRIRAALLRHTEPYDHERLAVRLRYSRGADFSGTCFYRDGRIFVNLGRANRYPYALATHVGKARCNRTHWWRESYRLLLPDAYHLVLFVYLHELYHYLVYTAGRCPRRKEAMCDRFAARVLVSEYDCPLVDAHGRPVPRERWDFQDLDRFVDAAPRVTPPLVPTRARPIPVVIRGLAVASRQNP